MSVEEELRLDRVDSSDVDEEGAASELDESATFEQKEKKKKRLRLARLKKKAKEHGYEFSGGSDVAGVLFVEIQKITDLPPEKNGMLEAWLTTILTNIASDPNVVRYGSFRCDVPG